MASLTYKKRVILAILEKFGRSISAKSMQKYLFIFSRMQLEDRIYDFVPYKYGCFSFNANQDLLSLVKGEYISIQETPNSERMYTLLHNMHAMSDLNMYDLQILTDIYRLYGKMSQDELIAYTYRRWPFTALNSVIKTHLLNKEELDEVERQRLKYIDETPMLFSMGYEGFTIEKYIRQLITNNVHVLVDVRKNAFSMKYGFTKAVLQKACVGVNIKYVHIPELGIESDKRQELKSQHDYDMLFDNYEKTTLKDNWKSLLSVRNILEAEHRICLLCFEKNPLQCHRTRVAKALMELPNRKYQFKELLL